MLLMKKKALPKKTTSPIHYAGLQARMMANLIDCTLIAILFFPLFAIIGNLIYGSVAPGEVLNMAAKEIEQLAKNDPSFNTYIFLKNNQQVYDYFVTNHGIIKVIIDMIFQAFFIGFIFVIFWLKKQATLGKMCLSLKIVDATTLEKPSSKQFIIRVFAIIISTLPLFLGIIWIAFDPKKQGWHDKIANTLVIKVK